MGEIRLTCPECGAEYRIAEGAIPPGGRSVECSSCGTVWHQPGIAASQDDAPAAILEAAPQLNRPLPDSVLSVLREEAELARRQRDTTLDGPIDAPRDGREAAPATLRAPEPSPEPGPPAEDWPATTVTTPLAGAIAAEQAAALPSDPLPAGPSPSRHINTRPNRPATTAPPHEVMEATVTRSTPHRPTGPATDPTGVTVEPAHHPSAHGYRRGFTWAIGIAAALLLLYVAAPRMADQGQLGATLMDWRLAVDDGRAWLDDRADSLLGRN